MYPLLSYSCGDCMQLSERRMLLMRTGELPDPDCQ